MKCIRTMYATVMAATFISVALCQQYASAAMISRYTFDADSLSSGVYINTVAGAAGADTEGRTTNVLDGKFGEAVRFNGTSDFLDAGVTGQPNGINLGTGSLAFWIRSTSTSLTPDQGVLGTVNTGFTTAVLVDIHQGTGVANDDRFRFFSRGEDVPASVTPTNGTDAEIFVGAKNAANPTGWRDGTWRHVAITWDRNSAANNVVYFDGVAATTGVTIDANAPNTTYLPFALLGGNGLTIGAYNVRGVMSNFLNADLDDMRIYDQVLSPSQVASLVPEPASAVLASIALMGAAMLWRRRK